MTKISVAYVIQSLGPGGAERQLVELVTHLDRSRFAVRVLTYFPGDFHRAQLERAGVSIYALARRGKLDFSPIAHLYRWLRTGEVDIVHAYLTSANAYAVVARQLARRGRVIASERSDPSRHTGLRRHYHLWAMRQADLVIANSRNARNHLLSLTGRDEQHIRFVPNGLDLARFHPVDQAARLALRQKLGWSPDRQYVLTVANYTAVKNHVGILDAVAHLDNTHATQQLIWAGALEPRGQFEAIAARIQAEGQSDRIQILGARTDTVDLYRAADVVLLNSVIEGTPNVVLEAMACGCPVIATDIADLRHYVLPDRTGWLIPPGDTSALRTALQRAAATTSERLQAMGRAGCEHIAQFDLDNAAMVSRHEALYRQLIQQ